MQGFVIRGVGQPAIGQSVHVQPCLSVPLVALPEVDNRRRNAPIVSVLVGEVTSHDRPESTALFGNVLVPALPEVLRDSQAFRHFTFGSRVPGQQEFALPQARADMREPKEAKGVRLALPTRRSRGLLAW